MKGLAGWLCLPLSLLLLEGCGPRILGYAVVLWGKEGSPPEGELLRVVERSEIRGSCTLLDESGTRRYELDGWRVRSFDREEQAREFQHAYDPYRESYAFTAREDGLPIRERPDTQSRRLYRLRPAQLVKVIGRGESVAQEGALEDYWYQVLTEDGYEGYCFGYYLRTFRSASRSAAARMDELAAEDPVLDMLLGDAWRPAYFADMISSGRIDLRTFGPDIGLFPDREAGVWRLELAGFSAQYGYEKIERPAPDTYMFPPTELRVTVYPRERIELTYGRNGRTTRTVFVRIAEDVGEIVEGEVARREELFAEFSGRGNRLSSSAYGTIELYDDGSFRWSGFGRIPQGVFARMVAGQGKLDFPCRLAPELEGSYDGSVSFMFDEYQSPEETVFVYSYAADGVQLTHVPAADIVDLEVLRIGVSPLVLYFTFGNR